MSKKKRGIPAWLHTPAYWALRGLVSGVLTQDLGANLALARGAARTYAKFEKSRVRRTMDTLGVAFPQMPIEERRVFAMHAYEHLFMLGIEMLHTPRLITPDTWPRYVQLGDLAAPARMMLNSRPCVLITGHCGNWELLGYTLALLGFPIHALYRPLDLKPMDTWVRQTRERRGLELVNKFGAAQRLPTIMRRGEPIAFIADQNAGDRGLFVPFFGRLASTYKAVGLSAMQFDAPVICGQARRLVIERDGDGKSLVDSGVPGSVGFSRFDPASSMQYRVDIFDIIMPEEWKSQPDPLFYISARYRRALESMVRIAPEQNLWLHRYWKSRPRHEHQQRPFPGALRAKLRALPWMTDDELAGIEDWSARDAHELANRPPKPSKVVAGV